jgi:cytochrome c2
VEIGRDLFIAKGCLTCHVNDRIEPRYISFSSQIGPNLTEYPTTAEYLRVWLKDPTSLKPATQMPNLELAEDEIEALIAFLISGQ